MDFKKMWKRFFTLDRHHAEGFTLVELIVVIAILAILGGVAVPAYSGYVEKANMGADIALVGEIEHALTLAGYNGTFADGTGGYIALSVDGVSGVDAGSPLEKALIATFGTGYADILKLKHDGWGSNGLYNNLNPEAAIAVKESSYMTGNRVDDLLADVETMTGMANNLVTVLAAGNSFLEGTTLSKMFTTADGTCVLDSTAEKYGIAKGENETWEQWAAGNNGANQTAYSNLLVLAAADEAEKYMTSQGGYTMSGASEMILEFSSFYAYAATNEEFSAQMDSYMAHLNGEETVTGLAPVTDASSGHAWFESLKAAAGTGFDDYMASTNATTGAPQSMVDHNGFLSILAGLGNPSEEQAKQVAADINNQNLFTTGVVNGMYNDYLDGVDAMSGMYTMTDENGNIVDYSEWTLGLGNGNVAVMFIQKDGKTVITSSLPTA